VKISWEPNGEHPTRWDSNCVRLKDNGPMWFGRIAARTDSCLLEVHRNAEGPACHWENCPTLAEAKRRGAEVLRALCGGPALKEATVWCGVTPKGRVLEYTTSRTSHEAWRKLVDDLPVQASVQWAKKDCGFTVRKFRIEEVR